MSATSGTRSVVAALIANTCIAVAKFIGFLITRSSAMLAESVHSVADAANQLLLLLGGRRSQRPPSEIHPFGFRKRDAQILYEVLDEEPGIEVVVHDPGAEVRQ